MRTILRSDPTRSLTRWQDNKWVELEQGNRILQSRLPEGMVFEDVPLNTVLKEISQATGLTIKAVER